MSKFSGIQGLAIMEPPRLSSRAEKMRAWRAKYPEKAKAAKLRQIEAAKARKAPEPQAEPLPEKNEIKARLYRDLLQEAQRKGYLATPSLQKDDFGLRLNAALSLK